MPAKIVNYNNTVSNEITFRDAQGVESNIEDKQFMHQMFRVVRNPGVPGVQRRQVDLPHEYRNVFPVEFNNNNPPQMCTTMCCNQPTIIVVPCRDNPTINAPTQRNNVRNVVRAKKTGWVAFDRSENA